MTRAALIGTTGLLLALSLATGGCGETVTATGDADGGKNADAGTPRDAAGQAGADIGQASADAGALDSGATTADVGSPDVGSADVGSRDVGSPDVGFPDSGTVAPDAGEVADAGARPPDGVKCAVGQCAAGESCCGSVTSVNPPPSCMAKCPSGTTASASCDGPEDCASGSPLCCAKISLGPGFQPNCPYKSIETSCVSSCASSIPFICPATMHMRLCHAAADCTSDPSGFTFCCVFAQGAAESTVCVPSYAKQSALRCL